MNEKELRIGEKTSEARADISCRLNRKLGVAGAKIGSHLGICTSAIAKPIQKFESADK